MSPTSPAGSPPDVGVVVPAAGRGDRAGGGTPKQFRPIAGVPMLLRALRPFLENPRVAHLVVALPASVLPAPPPWLVQLAGNRLRLVGGGETRMESVLAGLRELPAACTIVLVHDAARPFVSADTVNAVITAAAGGVGAVAALPVSDTVKRADPAGTVVETVPRDALWRAQTPQGFPRAMLETAYRRWSGNGGSPPATDDAAVVEAMGAPVRLIRDRVTNFKVTTPDDFLLAEAMAGR